MDWELFNIGLVVSAYGLGGVFGVLIIFYLTTKVMVLISNKLKTDKNA